MVQKRTSGLLRLPHFGLYLAHYREDRGWSQSELARQLKRRGYEISPGAINKYEAGERRPQGSLIAYLERCFGWDEEESQGALEALSTDYLADLLDQYQREKGKLE